MGNIVNAFSWPTLMQGKTTTTQQHVYKPNSSADGEETERTYNGIKWIILIVKGEENLLVMWDWSTTAERGLGKTI